MCYLNHNLLRTKDKIGFVTGRSIKPYNYLNVVVSHSLYFSLRDNFSLDYAMHDFSEGIGFYKLKKIFVLIDIEIDYYTNKFSGFPHIHNVHCADPTKFEISS